MDNSYNQEVLDMKSIGLGAITILLYLIGNAQAGVDAVSAGRHLVSQEFKDIAFTVSFIITCLYNVMKMYFMFKKKKDGDDTP